MIHCEVDISPSDPKHVPSAIGKMSLDRSYTAPISRYRSEEGTSAITKSHPSARMQIYSSILQRQNGIQLYANKQETSIQQ